MNDRHTADTINDDALDQLYDQAEAAEKENAELRDALAHCHEREPRLRAEAALARVRKACDSVKAADQGHNPAVDWVVMRVLEAIDARLVNGGGAPVSSGPAATQATEAGHVITVEGDPAAAHEAVRQMDADMTESHTGLVVQPYTVHGERKWVFRCWGTDTCDGWLSLDHYNEQSATRARDRHAAEEHPSEEQH